jgi:hypothetical protein
VILLTYLLLSSNLQNDLSLCVTLLTPVVGADHILESIHRIDAHVESPCFQERRQRSELFETLPDDRVRSIDVGIRKEGPFRICDGLW